MDRWYRSFVLLSVLCINLPLFAQEPTQVLPADLQSFTESRQFPEDLFYTKSVVFVSALDADGKESWKKLSMQAHKSFRKSGVDAVGYYYFDDIKAGRDVSRRLADDFSARQIKNIVVISQNNNGCGLAITQFSGDANFYDKDKAAYLQTGSSCDQLMTDFEKAAYREKAEVQNYLINDVPEYFVGAGSVITGRRNPGYAKDLKLDKLAVPKFPADNQTASSDSVSLSPKNAVLKEVMQQYPFDYGAVNPEANEDDLRQKEGYQFILLSLHTSRRHIQDMLNYSEEEAAEINSQSKSNGEAVYKFYVKHIYTGDVYVGDTWDADKDWNVALENYIRHMKASLNIGD